MFRRKTGRHEAITRQPSVEFLRNPMKALHALENPPAPTTAAQRLAPERRAEMRAAFAMFDADGGGAVSQAEIAAVFEMLGVTLGPGELDVLIAAVDEDGSGEVDFDEFCQLMEVVQQRGVPLPLKPGVRRAHTHGPMSRQRLAGHVCMQM